MSGSDHSLSNSLRPTMGLQSVLFAAPVVAEVVPAGLRGQGAGACVGERSRAGRVSRILRR